MQPGAAPARTDAPETAAHDRSGAPAAGRAPSNEAAVLRRLSSEVPAPTESRSRPFAPWRRADERPDVAGEPAVAEPPATAPVPEAVRPAGPSPGTDPQPVPASSAQDGEPGGDRAGGLVRRAAQWLFEQAPDRADDGPEPVRDVDEPTWSRAELIGLADVEAHRGSPEREPAITPEPAPAREPERTRPPGPVAQPEAEVEPEPAPMPDRSHSGIGPGGPTSAGPTSAGPGSYQRPRPRPGPGSALPREPRAATARSREAHGPTRGGQPDPEEPHHGAGVIAPPARVRVLPDQQPPQTTAEPDQKRRGFRRVLHTLVTVGIVLVAAVLLRSFVFAPYFIPSASMEPTLHGCPTCNNDHVLVNKLAYTLHGVHRGDVVVFDRPPTWHVSEPHLVKRVIGLPGDRLTVRGGKLYVNGLELDEPYLDPNCGPMTSLGESPRKPTKSYGPVPKGDVFVLGDNRCDSSDSRAFGPVPESDIVGRAFIIVWPLGRLHYL